MILNEQYFKDKFKIASLILFQSDISGLQS